MIHSIEWLGNKVRFLDQTELPLFEKYIETSELDVIVEAIVKLKVRGAPLIGIAATYGVLLGCLPYINSSNSKFREKTIDAIRMLSETRPTAKNLFWALERMENILRLYSTEETKMLFEKLRTEALSIHSEDRRMCEMMGIHGNTFIPNEAVILTHCNTGALATGGIGTALGVIKTAYQSEKKISVYVDETRPLFQGARLTMWELNREKIPATLITDNSAAWTIKTKRIDLIIVGADRITANGDTANKIGTYNLAILAKEHLIPFYVVAPTSTIDVSLKSGDQIPIEERNADEVTSIAGKRISPENSKVFGPAFDVTPNNLITAIITEKGAHLPPFEKSIAEAMRT